MPKSKRGARGRAATRTPAHRSTSPEQSPARRSRLRGNRWVILPLIIGGIVLFLMGNIGARTGIVLLPFDPHHVLAQFGGAAIFVLGLSLL